MFDLTMDVIIRRSAGLCSIHASCALELRRVFSQAVLPSLVQGGRADGSMLECLAGIDAHFKKQAVARRSMRSSCTVTGSYYGD